MPAIWEIEDKIRDVIVEIAENPIKKFYPTYVAKLTHLPLDIVFEHLLEMTKTGRLILEWEVICNSCYRKIITTNDFTSYINQEKTCHYCGEANHIDTHNILPAFTITEAFKESRQNKRSKKKLSLCIR